MNSRISVQPDIHFGKPCIVGTRIPVIAILELVSEGIPFPEILTDYYPSLEVEDIQACLRYAIEVVSAEEIHLAPAA